jgi:hypothetical protein
VEPRAVVLVEGVSDEVAVRTLAARRGRDLAAEGVDVVAMGGATNIGGYIERYGPRGQGLRLAGLCDANEEADFHRRLLRAGLAGRTMEELGFFVCHRDLEDELIRAAGADAVIAIAESEGELRSLRTMQKQAEHRDRPVDAQLRRFIGTKGGRKTRYARLLVEALDLTRVPPPLDALLTAV